MATTTATRSADILWRNGATGQNWMYLMDGATPFQEQALGVNTVADTNWQIVDNPNPPEGGGGVDPRSDAGCAAAVAGQTAGPVLERAARSRSRWVGLRC